MSEGKVSELTRALILARQGVRAVVHKADYNKHQGWGYVSHEQVLISGARTALLDNGLLLEQRAVEYVGEVPTEKRVMWRFRATFALCHVSGEERSYVWEGVVVPNDHAAYGASTALDRVAHLRLLELAGTDEDPEFEEERQARQGKAQQQPAREQQAPKPKHDAIGQLIHDLRFVKSGDQLVSWAQYLVNERATTEAKKPAWAAFGSRCEELKLDPREVAAAARSK